MKGCEKILKIDTKTQRDYRKAMLIAMVNIYYNAGKIDLSRYYAMLHEIEHRYADTRVKGYEECRTAAERSGNYPR